MRRRDFIKCAGSVVAWPLPLVAHAQQPPMPVIGWLSSGSRETDDVYRLPSFRLGLNETGYTEGRNVTIEYRRVDDQIERLRHSPLIWLAGRYRSSWRRAARPPHWRQSR